MNGINIKKITYYLQDKIIPKSNLHFYNIY
jgi:hypothetical protein